MKSSGWFLVFSLCSSLAHAACPGEEILRQVQASANVWVRPANGAAVNYVSTFVPGEERTIHIWGEDFLFRNRALFKQDIYVVDGRTVANCATIWAVIADSSSCRVVEASEIMCNRLGSLSTMRRVK